MNSTTTIQTPLQNASRAGLILGLLFVLKYLMLMNALTMPLLGILYLAGTIAVPFVAYRLTKQYRDSLPQEIPFQLVVAWSHGILLYAFASVLVLIPHYFYYTEILPSQIPILEENIRQSYASDPNLEAMFKTLLGGQSIGDILNKWLVSTSIASKLWSDFSSNILWGAIFSLINALILKRESKA